MGSFRPIVGSLHLHRQYNFTEPLVETALKSLRHSCGSELTRQGISLDVVTSPWRAMARSFLPHSGCRHAVRTISSPHVRGVWRLVSEDSNQLGSGFPSVHRLGNVSDLDESVASEV